MNVVVTGTLAYDYIMDFPGRFADRIMPDSIHKISLSFLVDKLNKQFGGTAGNIAYTLKLLGLEPYIVAAAGNDFAPYKKFLTSHRVSTKYIKEYNDVSTGLYFVITDQDDNQIGSFYAGAMKNSKNSSLRSFQGVALRGKATPYENFVVIAPNDPLAMKKYVRECRKFSFPYLYDPAFQIATFTARELREGIEGARVLIGNDYEIAMIEKTLEVSHEELRTMAPIIITTLGSKGSIIETRYESIHVHPAKPKNTSDPTGAGDAFRAGFIAGYLKALGRKHVQHLRGESIRTSEVSQAAMTADDLLICGQMGSVAAVYTVETYGTQTHHFTKKEFIARYKENFHSIINL